jgi:hypothetical protein
MSIDGIPQPQSIDDIPQQQSTFPHECRSQTIMKLSEAELEVVLSERPQVVRLQLSAELGVLTRRSQPQTTGLAPGATALLAVNCTDEFRMSIGWDAVQWQHAD